MVARLRNGRVHVIDWKGVTDLKSSLKPGHVGQLAAYRAMLEEAGKLYKDAHWCALAAPAGY